MQLLGKQFFSSNENELLEGAMDEKRLLRAGAGAEEMEIPDEAAQMLKEAVEESENRWYRKSWRFVKENRKHLIVAASVLVIGVAVYLNWYLYQADSKGITEQQVAKGKDAALSEAMASEAATGSDYFAVSQINRERARDEAIEVLQTVIDGTGSEDAIQEATASMAQIAEDIESEQAIETMVKSKGFADCVAVISGESCSVIVKSDGLLNNEVAQIQEIVYESSGILPVNLKIIEK